MKYLILFFLYSFVSWSDEGLTVVAVGDATRVREKILFIQNVDEIKTLPHYIQMSKTLSELLKNDFLFYKKFFEVEGSDEKNFISDQVLQEKNVAYSCRLTFKLKEGQLELAVTLYNVSKKENIWETQARIDVKGLRAIGHTIADELYQKITGKESIFKTKIVFVSSKASKPGHQIKELYIMDFDGRGRKQLTYHGGVVISPAISYDGTQILYSLIRGNVRKRRNISLYLYNLRSGKISLISDRAGINSGAIFLPDNKHIALTLTADGNAEIYAMNLSNKETRKITSHFAVDVDPSVTTDGKLMAFLSGRPGKPMIYTLDPSDTEKNVVRISYVGEFNATPRFSPDGKEIVFVSWLDNCFDIFRINPDGTGLSRLTKDFGSNEDPTYSKDGQFIAFSSKRILSRQEAEHNIYIMDRDGEILGNLTKGFGNCITPRWSK